MLEIREKYTESLNGFLDICFHLMEVGGRKSVRKTWVRVNNERIAALYIPCSPLPAFRPTRNPQCLATMRHRKHAFLHRLVSPPHFHLPLFHRRISLSLPPLVMCLPSGTNATAYMLSLSSRLALLSFCRTPLEGDLFTFDPCILVSIAALSFFLPLPSSVGFSSKCSCQYPPFCSPARVLTILWFPASIVAGYQNGGRRVAWLLTCCTPFSHRTHVPSY